MIDRQALHCCLSGLRFPAGPEEIYAGRADAHATPTSTSRRLPLAQRAVWEKRRRQPCVWPGRTAAAPVTVRSRYTASAQRLGRLLV